MSKTTTVRERESLAVAAHNVLGPFVDALSPTDHVGLSAALA